MTKKFLTGQAVILAAGRGERTYPFTLIRPKPLLKVLGKSILEHNLDQLADLVKEVILVIGYKREQIKKFIGSQYKNLKITYVLQKKQIGTGDAAKRTSPLLKDKFLLLNGDDFYEKTDIRKCLKKAPTLLLKEVKNPSAFGQVLIKKNLVENLIEKPEKPVSNLVNTGLYFLDKSIFNFKIQKSSRGEYEFTDYLKTLAKREELYYQSAKNWVPVSYLWHLLDVIEFLFKKTKSFQKGKIEKNCQISGKAIIEKGTVIKSGSYLEGPIYIGKNSLIGPNCHLKGPISIGDNCRLGQAVEIKSSIIGDNSKISHLSYLGDSIIGNNCNLGAGAILANLRFDGKTIKSEVNGKLIDTQREKFGCILGDNVKIGVNASLMPGVLVGPNSIIGPHSLVMENIEDNKIFYAKFQSIVKKGNKI